MLVSKEPLAPANGTQDTDHDGGQQGGLSVNWSVPNVLVKDVPDFERLSPELEAGTAPPSCPCSPTRALRTGAWGQGPYPEGPRGLEGDRTHLPSVSRVPSVMRRPFYLLCHSLRSTTVRPGVFLTPFH